MTLADFLRHRRRLTGTHVGCEHGVCGACAVLFDGQALKSCLLLAVQAHGHEIRTVESLAGPGELHPLQAAFRDAHALQCGFCTPGFLMTAVALAQSRPETLTENELRDELAGNLCRCTGYQGILAAVDSYLKVPLEGEDPG
jgi:aerobic-type carbon monoxide dehydrogenase small subunit (CoxS/CutS family)